MHKAHRKTGIYNSDPESEPVRISPLSPMCGLEDVMIRVMKDCELGAFRAVEDNGGICNYLDTSQGGRRARKYATERQQLVCYDH